ncbi:MAG TPA: hypothetical protein K8V13_00035 [Enterobacter roggenkampii]|nr:hypothetical protein [Enterobacter roggenkampii]
MLDRLKTANTYLGPFTPEDLYRLTPAQFEYMLAGAQQRLLNDRAYSFKLTKATVPAVLVDKNDNDEAIASDLRKSQEAISNFNNAEYQKEQQEKAERQKQFRNIFGKYLNRSHEKGGG